jgi:hypothetical protein
MLVMRIRPEIALTLMFLGACSEPTTDIGDAGSRIRDVGSDSMDASITADAEPAMDTGMAVDSGHDAGPELIDPTTEPYRTLRSSGPSSNRIDLVIVGDGYTLEELTTTYDDHADRLATQIFERRGGSMDLTQPFRQYADYFNVHRIHLASSESGIDDPETGAAVDTALDGTTACADPIDGPCQVDFTKVQSAIDSALNGTDISPDWRVVVLNTDEPSGGAYTSSASGGLAVYGGAYGSGRRSYFAREIALRELAHVYANAGYEAFTENTQYTGPEPRFANVSTSSTVAKWAIWHGYDSRRDGVSTIGAHEGAAGYAQGLYRPAEASKMGDQLDQEVRRFDAIIREQIILTIYQHVRPIDSHSDNNEALMNPKILWLQVVDTDRINVEWSINDTTIEVVDTTFGFTAYARAMGLSNGRHLVSARAYDDTEWVRTSSLTLSQTVTWQVDLDI